MVDTNGLWRQLERWCLLRRRQQDQQARTDRTYGFDYRCGVPTPNSKSRASPRAFTLFGVSAPNSSPILAPRLHCYDGYIKRPSTPGAVKSFVISRPDARVVKIHASARRGEVTGAKRTINAILWSLRPERHLPQHYPHLGIHFGGHLDHIQRRECRYGVHMLFVPPIGRWKECW